MYGIHKNYCLIRYLVLVSEFIDFYKRVYGLSWYPISERVESDVLDHVDG